MTPEERPHHLLHAAAGGGVRAPARHRQSGEGNRVIISIYRDDMQYI
jgi:hypothetical protein